MDRARLEQRLRDGLQDGVRGVVPSPEWWHRAMSRLAEGERRPRPAAAWFRPAFITAPLSLFLLLVLVGGLLPMFGGMSPPPPRPPAVVADSSGGAFLFWLDSPDSYGDGACAQHVSAGGSLLWGEGRLLSREYDIYSGVPLAVTDSDGGVIIAWGDEEGIFVRRLDAAGDGIWDNGVLVWARPAGGGHSLIGMIADGMGGAVLLREGSDYGVYAQRVDTGGSLLWGEAGAYLGEIQLAYQGVPMVSDGAGGTVILWTDSGVRWTELYAQRIGADGSLAWESGVSVISRDSEKDRPQLIGDGAGGFIVTWADITSGTFASSIYAQKLDADGRRLWGGTGALVADGDDIPQDPYVTADGSGGVIVAWHCVQQTDAGNLFAQRLGPGGEPLWGDGVPLCSVGDDSPYLAISNASITNIIGDGAGNSLVVWKDGGGTLYAQKLDADGRRLWPEDGIEIYRGAPRLNFGYSSLTGDGSGGFIIGSRASAGGSLSQTDAVYAQRIGADGSRLWGEGGLAVQEKPSSPILLLIAAAFILVTVLVLYGISRRSRLVAVFSAIAPVLFGITALFGTLLLTGIFGYSYAWAYVLGTPLNQAAAVSIPAAGLTIAVTAVWRRSVTRWVMVPVLVFGVLAAALAGLLIFA